MKPLNRPMFRMGGPIKEGIMDGIEEPRQGFQDGTKPGFFGLSFDQPVLTGANTKKFFQNLLKLDTNKYERYKKLHLNFALLQK